MAISDEEKKAAALLRKHNITVKELEAILSSSHHRPQKDEEISVSKKGFTYLYVSDAHIGHEKFHEELFKKATIYAGHYAVDFVLDAGDHLEGMSGRPGHIYELHDIGFQAQSDHAVTLYEQFKKPIYAIDGNHDGWYEQKNNAGVVVGKELEKRIKDYHHLGQMEGNLTVDGIKILLYHGGDGTAYADSYKLQKLIESLSGGEKPHIIHSGHYHKHLVMFKRNIWGVESGTLMGQSRWMRGKKIEAAMGFGIVKVSKNPDGGFEVDHKWVPYFEQSSTSYATGRRGR